MLYTTLSHGRESIVEISRGVFALNLFPICEELSNKVCSVLNKAISIDNLGPDLFCRLTLEREMLCRSIDHLWGTISLFTKSKDVLREPEGFLM